MSNKIVFMGTPDFAVESLKQLINHNFEVVGVVTAPDRPAGRGQQLRASAVKQFALEHQLNILQPEKLKDEGFIQGLQKLGADLFVVVAFRMLPEVVWSMPKLGTINLHGSLLPDYRGAAPINWAVINGEEETGATTFFIEKEIDTGKVIDTVKVAIGENDSAGTVHDALMLEGGKLLADTVGKIFEGKAVGTPQGDLIKGELKEAPKIFKPDCRIDWSTNCRDVHNKIRGLSPYPTAWTTIEKEGSQKTIKLFDSIRLFKGTNHSSEIKVDENRLFFGTSDGWIEILQLQLEGKKRMSVSDFLKGFQIQDWKLI